MKKKKKLFLQFQIPGFPSVKYELVKAFILIWKMRLDMIYPTHSACRCPFPTCRRFIYLIYLHLRLMTDSAIIVFVYFLVAVSVRWWIVCFKLLLWSRFFFFSSPCGQALNFSYFENIKWHKTKYIQPANFEQWLVVSENETAGNKSLFTKTNLLLAFRIERNFLEFWLLERNDTI